MMVTNSRLILLDFVKNNVFYYSIEVAYTNPMKLPRKVINHSIFVLEYSQRSNWFIINNILKKLKPLGNPWGFYVWSSVAHFRVTFLYLHSRMAANGHLLEFAYHSQTFSIHIDIRSHSVPFAIDMEAPAAIEFCWLYCVHSPVWSLVSIDWKFQWKEIWIHT